MLRRAMPLNRGFTYIAEAGSDATGLRLSHWLASRYAHSDATSWQDRFAAGELLVDETPVRHDLLLRRGSRIIWHRPPWNEPEVERRFDRLHEDEQLLAVAKPSGLPCEPAGGFLEQTLLAVVRESYPEAIPMHRLGRDTSGVVLFARTREAAAHLQAQWRARSVFKSYRALGKGRCRTPVLTVTARIGPISHARLGTLHAADAAGKLSESRFVVREWREGATLWDVQIATGRPHQIRIHAAAAGHPLVGEPLYCVGGRPLPDNVVLPGAGGYLLHAHRLSVIHPETGRPISFLAPPPRALQAADEPSLAPGAPPEG